MTRTHEALSALLRGVTLRRRPESRLHLSAWNRPPRGAVPGGAPLPGKALLRRTAAAWALCGLAGVAMWLAAGCGYRVDTPRLPGNAGTLAIGVIRNRTFQGELDVRLQHRLRSLLLKHPGFELGAPDHSDLILDIELTQFRVVRARDLASVNLNSVSFQLVGLVSVYDRRQSRYYVNRQPVNSTSRLDFDAPTVETPAIRDEGLEDAVLSFATQVENLVFLTF
jgi:hypothetical protein